MSLYMVDDCLPVDYVICLINSDFISNYVNDFINNTSIFQINDARQLPIIIPNNEQLDTILSLVKNAIEIKIQESKKTLTKEEAKIKIQDVETAMNKVVNKLYGV